MIGYQEGQAGCFNLYLAIGSTPSPFCGNSKLSSVPLLLLLLLPGHGCWSTVSLQVLAELGSKVSQKGGIHHLLEPRHFISRLRKCDEDRVL